jgi:hypothetical protein
MEDHFTVFYAWQSDTDSKVNHYFIRDAAQAAIDDVVAELRIEEAPEFDSDTPVGQPATDGADQPPIKLDHDIKDEPGTPNVAEVIFRKIGDCGVFLADLTYAGEVEVSGDRNKRMPNSNVLIELGLAAASVGWRHIILVQNTHFGNVGYLPFDLRNYSHPVTYTLAPGADKATREAQKRSLTDELKKKLKIMKTQGVWTKKGEDRQMIAAAIKAEHERKAREARDAFEQKILVGTMSHFAAGQDVMTVSIIPAEPLDPPLDFRGRSTDETLRQILWPMRSGSSELRQTSDRRSIFSSPYPTERADLYAKLPQFTVTELTDTGMLYAANNWKEDGHKPIPTGPTIYDMQRYQPRFVIDVARYLTGLRTLKVGGTLYLDVSFLKTSAFGFRAHEEDIFMGRGSPGGKDIHTTTVLVEPKTDLSFEGVTKLLRSALFHLWNEAGRNQAPIYDETGAIIDWEK